MTKKELENRLEEIEKAMQQCVANFNMLEGAKNECLYWQKKFEELKHVGN